jgi:glycosyltransferase involved in cell wall biosynthesis
MRLIMIGDIHERERERFAARIRALELDHAVVLPGPLTDRLELSRYYQLSNVVLFPSQYEQFGIVAIEAVASGRPLLGTPVGIMQTLVPRYQFGLLHPFGDIDRFERNASELLDRPEYRENAARHRQEILQRYDWRTISAETEAIYKHSVKEGR